MSGKIESGKCSAWSVGFGGVAEGLAKMAFGNRIGAEVTTDESDYEYAWFDSRWRATASGLPGGRTAGCDRRRRSLTVNGVRMPLDGLYEANTVKFTTVYPDKGENRADVMKRRTRTPHLAYEAKSGIDGLPAVFPARTAITIRPRRSAMREPR